MDTLESLDALTTEETSSQSQPSSLSWVVFLVIALIMVCGGLSRSLPSHPSQPHSSSAVPMLSGSHSLYGSPSISISQIENILTYYHSPASGEGHILYDLSVSYGIDPIYPLAFFEHESNFGAKGEASYTHSLGNLRCISGYPCVDADRGGYAYFPTWGDGFHAWFDLLTGDLYKGDGLTTIESIIPRYAPSADNNNESAYIQSLLYCVNTWHKGQVSL